MKYLECKHELTSIPNNGEVGPGVDKSFVARGDRRRDRVVRAAGVHIEGKLAGVWCRARARPLLFLDKNMRFIEKLHQKRLHKRKHRILMRTLGCGRSTAQFTVASTAAVAASTAAWSATSRSSE
jgi:hypothetical protein